MTFRNKYKILIFTSIILIITIGGLMFYFMNTKQKQTEHKLNKKIEKIEQKVINIKKIESNTQVANLLSGDNVTKTESDSLKDKKIDVSFIPTQFAIQYKTESGFNQIAVFVDLNSNFSRDFVSNIDKIKNSTIYIFPILGDDEYIEKIFCSNDQFNSLYLYINNKSMQSTDRNCNKDGIEYYQKYYQENFNLTDLPVIIFQNGNYVKNANNANYDLINEYLGG